MAVPAVTAAEASHPLPDRPPRRRVIQLVVAWWCFTFGPAKRYRLQLVRSAALRLLQRYKHENSLKVLTMVS